MARSMVSLGMLPLFASRIALRRRALASGSPPPVRAATVISLMNFVNSLPRLASSAPFLCLILCHLECPDIGIRSFWSLWVGWAIYHNRGFLTQRRKECKATSAPRTLFSPQRALASHDQHLSTSQRNLDTR